MNQELLKQILNQITAYQDNAIYHGKVIDIYRGQLKKYIIEALIQEFPKSYPQMLSLIPPINLIKQYVQKVNQAYIEEPRRTATNNNDKDQALMEYLVDKLDINELMEQLSSFISLNKYASIQLAYDIETQSPILEFLPADHFIPFASNPHFPNKLTHLIKFAGRKQKVIPIFADTNGKKLENPSTEIREVNVYHIFDRDYLYTVEGTEIVKQEPNEYKKLPFLFGREDKGQLIPTPDSDMLAMAILLPKKLASLNNALKAQSHSIIYGVDVDLNPGMIIAPDIIWNLKSEYKGEQKTSPSIGTISPTVQASSVIQSYEFQLRAWLESKGLKAGQVNASSTMASGDSKAMDEADATAVRQNKVRLMAKLEKEFWSLLKTCWNDWVTKGLEQSYEDDGFAYPFSDEFKMTITFASQEPKEDMTTILNELKLMKDLGVLTDRMALERIYPEKSSEDIDGILLALNEQKAQSIKQAQSNMVDNVNGQNNNIDQQNQDPTKGQ